MSQCRGNHSDRCSMLSGLRWCLVFWVGLTDYFIIVRYVSMQVGVPLIGIASVHSEEWSGVDILAEDVRAEVSTLMQCIDAARFIPHASQPLKYEWSRCDRRGWHPWRVWNHLLDDVWCEIAIAGVLWCHVLLSHLQHSLFLQPRTYPPELWQLLAHIVYRRSLWMQQRPPPTAITCNCFFRYRVVSNVVISAFLLHYAKGLILRHCSTYLQCCYTSSWHY